MPPCAFATLHGMEESNVKETQAEKIARIKRGLDAVPTLPGVYLWKDKDGQVIYVGKAKQLRARMRQYVNFQDDRAIRLTRSSTSSSATSTSRSSLRRT